MVDSIVKGIRGTGVHLHRSGRNDRPSGLSCTPGTGRYPQGSLWPRPGGDLLKRGEKVGSGGLQAIWLASTIPGQKAIREKTDLTAFKERPSTRFLTGVGLILISYVFGWPMVGLFSFLAAYFQNASLLIGGPITFGFSHLVFLAGMYLAGRGSLKYVEIFFLWSLRSLAERLTGQDSAKTIGYEGRGSG